MRRAASAVALALVIAFLGAVGCSPTMRANLYSTALQDNQPIAPFAIAPDLYYVGSSDIAVFVLRTRDGLILIDSGYESTARRVPANMRALGLDPAEVRVLLSTHAHVDHAAGLAALKRLTRAELYAGARDVALLESGGRGDFFLGDWMRYPPVTVDHAVHDGDVVRLGERTITAHATPGHTKGCTSWSFSIVVDGREVQALVLCSLGTLRYPLVGNENYPEIASDFEHTYALLRTLPCELFLGAHGKFFDLEAKRRRMRDGAANPFLDSAGCRAYIEDSERSFRAELARQQGRGGEAP
jgi:metallo-beta-lactamase class B